MDLSKLFFGKKNSIFCTFSNIYKPIDSSTSFKNRPPVKRDIFLSGT